jgi:MOSC domain-containing protein YiiM
MTATVTTVSLSSRHSFSKFNTSSIVLLEGLGVEGDAHWRYHSQTSLPHCADQNQPNLRQVHIIHSELFDELAVQGFAMEPGALGENITTRGRRPVIPACLHRITVP